MSESTLRDGATSPLVGRPRPLISIAAVMAFTAGAVSFLLAPLLPAIQREFDISVGDAAWVFTLLLIGSGVSVVMLPRLSDALGDRVAATLGAGALATGAFIPGVLTSYPALLVGVMIMGLGAATGQLGVGVLRRHLPGGSIRTAVTVTQVSAGLGSGAGLLVGGLALEEVSIEAFFLSVAALFVIVAASAWLIIPSSPRVPAAQFGIVDLVGLVLWVVPLLYGIKAAAASGFHLDSIMFIVVGAAGAAAWIQLERRSSAPVLKLSLLKTPLVAKTVIAGFTLGLAIQAVAFLIPFFVQASPEAAGYGFGYSVLRSGLVLLPYSLVGAIFGAIGGYYVGRGRALTVTGVGAACHAAAGTFLMLNLAHPSAFVVAAVIYGIGSGLAGVGLIGAMQTAVPAELTGMGVSMVGFIMMISGALGSAVYSGILQSKSVVGMPGVPALDRFVLCFVIACICDVLVAALCLWSRRGKGSSATASETAESVMG
jgi:MFS family permease